MFLVVIYRDQDLKITKIWPFLTLIKNLQTQVRILYFSKLAKANKRMKEKI
tara:strand:- start:160 stop:312 length:153 start_codon:yes stop_codon:yes gene_type:complete